MIGSVAAPPIVIQGSRSKAAILLVGCAAAIVTIVYFHTYGHGPLISVLRRRFFTLLAAFGLLGLVQGFLLFAPGRIVLNEHGLSYRAGFRNEFYTWEQVQDLHVTSKPMVTRKRLLNVAPSHVVFTNLTPGGPSTVSLGYGWELMPGPLCALIENTRTHYLNKS